MFSLIHFLAPFLKGFNFFSFLTLTGRELNSDAPRYINPDFDDSSLQAGKTIFGPLHVRLGFLSSSSNFSLFARYFGFPELVTLLTSITV